MRATARLGLYGLVLAAVFAIAAVTANAVVPEETVLRWTQAADEATHHAAEDDTESSEHGGSVADGSAPGLGLEQSGYRLGDVTTPAATDTAGELSLLIIDPGGKPLTAFTPEHDKELHLIVVRADGQHFRHVHPQRATDGTWSIPWTWQAAGTYRVFADFVPAQADAGMTLSTSVQVAGDYDPVATEQITTTSVDGYEVTVTGLLAAGESSQLTMTVRRDGQPVTTLEPYLGAYGHLVALREGDLAYLHVHPQGDAPEPGETSGPRIVFEATAPTPGRYLLYLDFQVDGQVHSAPLVVDTAAKPSSAQHTTGETSGNSATTEEHTHEEGSADDHGE